MKKIVCFLAAFTLMTGCSQAAPLNENAVLASSQTIPYTDWEQESYTAIELTTESVSITKPGTYVLSGILEAGSVRVDTEGTVRIVLNNASITSSEGPAIIITNAEKTILSIPEGTENYVSDSSVYPADTEEPDAAVFSKDDLIINGSGTLIMNGNYQKALKGKDDVSILDTTLTIQAIDDGIIGRDSLTLQNASITVQAQADGIKTTNDQDTDKGNLVINGGSYHITAGQDGMQAEGNLTVTEGAFIITTGGGSEKNTEQKQTTPVGGGGMPRDAANRHTPAPENRQPPENAAPSAEQTPPAEELFMRPEPPQEMPAENFVPQGTQAEETSDISRKGMKATGKLTISAGEFEIDAYDDAIHSNSDIEIKDGALLLKTGDDAIHADNELTVSGGAITIEKSYEGLEAEVLHLNGGTIHLLSSDDGINAAGNSSETSVEAAIYLNGSTISINAEGDGIDSNGIITMSDGSVTINGPSNGGNSALDYDKSFDISGGTLFASGSAGMLQAPSDTSSQYTLVLLPTDTIEVGTTINIKNEAGETILSYMPEKACQSIVISSPSLKPDTSYTIAWLEKETPAFSLSQKITYISENGITEGFTRQGRGGGGQRSNSGMQPRKIETPAS